LNPGLILHDAFLKIPHAVYIVYGLS